MGDTLAAVQSAPIPVQLAPRQSGQRHKGAVLAMPLSHVDGFTLPVTTLTILVGTITLRNEDKRFYHRMETPLESRKHWYDAPLSALPLGAMLTLKALGVSSRDTWGRMLASDAIGGAIAYSMSSVLKQWVAQPRPDGSGKTSYPSAHTVLAYAGASMLEEEYGHLSPWVPIGGYTVATATAFLRIHEGRHWSSDVIKGMSLGINSVKAGYLIGDILFRERGRKLEDVPYILDTRSECPSYAALYSEAVLMPGDYRLGDGRRLAFKSGYGAGVDGGWFQSPHFGTGARAGQTTLLPEVDRVSIGEQVTFAGAEVGLLYSQPIGGRLLLGARLAGGMLQQTEGKSALRQQGISLDQLYSASAGISLDYRTRKHLSTRFFADYSLLMRRSTQQSVGIGVATAYRF